MRFHEQEFFLAGEFFYGGFALQGLAFGCKLFSVDYVPAPVGASVLRSFAGVMEPLPPFQVVGAARIQTAICALEQVKVVHG